MDTVWTTDTKERKGLWDSQVDFEIAANKMFIKM